MSIKRILLDPSNPEIWADVRDVDELNAGDRRAVKAAYSLKIDPETRELSVPGDYNELTRNTLAALVITNWSLPLPLPRSDRRVLDRLSMKQLDAIYEGITPHIEAINEAEQVSARDQGSVPTSDSAI